MGRPGKRPSYVDHAARRGAALGLDSPFDCVQRRLGRLSPGDLCREEVACGEEGFSEVAGYDFFGVTDGGQVDAGIPAEQ